jgi:hypothetical protein
MDEFSPASLGMAVAPAAGGGGLSFPSVSSTKTSGSNGHGLERTAIAAVSHPLHPDNGLFWMGLILFVSVGLIGATVSVSGRAGPLHASAGAGAGKT